MLIPDSTPVFPACPAFGFTVEPIILTRHVSTESGREASVRLWAEALREFTSVPIGDRVEPDIQQILYFWLAVGGTSGRFRFLDYSDYKSCQSHETPAAVDQPIIHEHDEFRLYKQYSFGPLIHERRIRRPIGATVSIANAGGVIQEPSSWTLDESNGVITTEGTFDGAPTFWGGEFHVLARFWAELPIEISTARLQSTAFTVKEVRESA